MTVTLTKYLNQTTVAILRHQLKEKKNYANNIYIRVFIRSNTHKFSDVSTAEL